MMEGEGTQRLTLGEIGVIEAAKLVADAGTGRIRYSIDDALPKLYGAVDALRDEELAETGEGD